MGDRVWWSPGGLLVRFADPSSSVVAPAFSLVHKLLLLAITLTFLVWILIPLRPGIGKLRSTIREAIQWLLSLKPKDAPSDAVSEAAAAGVPGSDRSSGSTIGSLARILIAAIAGFAFANLPFEPLKNLVKEMNQLTHELNDARQRQVRALTDLEKGLAKAGQDAELVARRLDDLVNRRNELLGGVDLSLREMTERIGRLEMEVRRIADAGELSGQFRDVVADLSKTLVVIGENPGAGATVDPGLAQAIQDLVAKIDALNLAPGATPDERVEMQRSLAAIAAELKRVRETIESMGG